MKLRFDEKKAAQAAAQLLHREGGRMSHMKLIKLLYLAERQAILRWGRPITFDSYFSLPHGPVLSLTLDRLNQQEEPEGVSYWHSLISERQGHEVALRDDDPPSTELSRAEEALLGEVYEMFGHMDQWQLRDYSHTLPEWRDPSGSSVRIRIREILMGEGVAEEEAAEVERDLADESEFAHRFGA